MKKVFVLMLALAGIAPLFAQQIYNPSSITEFMFNLPKPKSLPTNFDFRLANRNMLTLEFMRINQLKELVNLDSLIEKVWQDLQPLKDSLNKPLVNRRVDYDYLPDGAQIRIVEYPQKGNTYKYLDNELVQTKVEQDTLRIRIQTSTKIISKDISMGGMPYYIMLRLNNLSDIELLPSGSLNNAVNMLRSDVDSILNKRKKKDLNRYNAVYDVASQKRIVPISNSLVANSLGPAKRNFFEPYIQLGLGYTRGAWAPSAGLGTQLIHGYYNADRQVFKLYWEPYFFFTHSASNDLMTQRGDFITFKYNEVKARQNNFADLNTNFSISYLVGNKGNWFEPATFKFAVPGFGMKNMNLEPEFVFNKFFKNFTPSLRLSLEIE